MAEVKPPKTLVEPITSVEFSVALRVVAGVKALMRSDLANLEIGAKLSLYQLAPHEVEMFARSGSEEVRIGLGRLVEDADGVTIEVTDLDHAALAVIRRHELY